MYIYIERGGGALVEIVAKDARENYAHDFREEHQDHEIDRRLSTHIHTHAHTHTPSPVDVGVGHGEVDVPARGPRHVTLLPHHVVCPHHLGVLVRA